MLCVAVDYYPPAGDAEAAGDLWPRVARYARGDDYHDFLDARLQALERRIRDAFPGVASRRYIDTGPVLERELAARAGLGVVGKNTNLLHPEAGSWFLLGEIFLSFELAATTPLTDLCGSCTQCLEACPTGALPQPYRLDAGRCISYWTIEHRGVVPPEIRPLLEDWVFGCDVCQEVCPVNVAPSLATDDSFRLRSRRRRLDLTALLGLDRRAYVELFRGSPTKRAKLEGLKRNAAIAMGNRGEGRYVTALAAALADEDPGVRSHAAWALGRIGGREARRRLEERLEAEADEDVRGELERALRSLP